MESGKSTLIQTVHAYIPDTGIKFHIPVVIILTQILILMNSGQSMLNQSLPA
jgi:hypothetical protein